MLGRDHPETLVTRHNIAFWTGAVGDAPEALRLFRELLPDQERVLGRDHPDMLTTRGNIAAWTGDLGDALKALQLFTALLPDQERVLGRDHPNTLNIRHNIARWTGEAGDARGALQLSTALLPDRERVLGRDHPSTLITRQNIASWTGEAGDARGRCNSSPRCCRTRSGCWAATTPTRSPPSVMSESGPSGAVTRRRDAGGCRGTDAPEARFGPDHPLTRTFQTLRGQVASWAGEAGDAPEALRLFRELLPDEERVLGRDHPDTLNNRHNIAAWTGEAGNAPEALRLFRELLPDEERVLGRDHPDTLNNRHNIAAWTGEVGDAPRRCGCSASCCRTGSGCWAATTPIRSPPVVTSLVGPARWAMRRGAAAVPRAAAGPGAGAGPRPPRHAHHPW